MRLLRPMSMFRVTMRVVVRMKKEQRKIKAHARIGRRKVSSGVMGMVCLDGCPSLGLVVVE